MRISENEGQCLSVGLYPMIQNQPVIYFTVDPTQQNFCSTAILDTLLQTHENLHGQFDVIRHWTTRKL